MKPPTHDFQGSVYNPAYPGELEAIFHRSESDADVLNQLLPVLGYLIKCDYCLLYLRHPRQRYSRITHYWEKTNDHPVIVEDSWHPEDKNLLDSPLFNAALAAEHSVFIENVDDGYKNLHNTDPLVREEQAIAQGHIVKDDQLWGILRVGILDRPRLWMQFDHSLIIHSAQRLVPNVINYVDAQLV
ncbi:MAG: hypothetical protein ACFB2W_20235 [Leptolyngbyaceae cyanobacterium]